MATLTIVPFQRRPHAVGLAVSLETECLVGTSSWGNLPLDRPTLDFKHLAAASAASAATRHPHDMDTDAPGLDGACVLPWEQNIHGARENLQF